VYFQIRERARMRSLGLHYLKFNLVGALGIIVQLLALQLFTAILGLNYLVATGLAVEMAILHNFALHQRWTWSDRPRRNPIESVHRLLRFNSTTGVISIIGNLIFMKMLSGQLHLPIPLANLLSIAACSLFNFLIANSFVFRREE
jgi:putative flippase GtrA